jgi:hypothetical protein
VSGFGIQGILDSRARVSQYGSQARRRHDQAVDRYDVAGIATVSGFGTVITGDFDVKNRTLGIVGEPNRDSSGI